MIQVIFDSAGTLLRHCVDFTSSSPRRVSEARFVFDMLGFVLN